jgi:hypothetical protein
MADSAVNRARVSSPRLVSCVEVAIMAEGQRAARSRLASCTASRERPKRSGVPPTSFSAMNRL